MSIGSFLGITQPDSSTDPAQPPVGGAPPTSPPVDPNGMKMMLARALMGGQGGGGAPPTSFAGGLSQGMNPLVQQMMMQKLMGGMPGMQQPAAPAPQVPPTLFPQGGMSTPVPQG